MDREQVKNQALKDQAFTGIQDREQDIKDASIVMTGQLSDTDTPVQVSQHHASAILLCLFYLLGEICAKRKEMNDLDPH